MIVKQRTHIFFKIFIKSQIFEKNTCQIYAVYVITISRDAYTLSQKGV